MTDPPVEPELIIGTAEQRSRFLKRHQDFVEEMPNLYALARAVFEREYLSDQTSAVIYSLGLLAWEDFEELFALAGIGSGFGALKLLRGFYERVVTLAYLQKHQSEIDKFVSYEAIRRYKIACEVHENVPESAVSAHDLEGFRHERESVARMFKTSCSQVKGCANEITMHSWSKIGIPQMADKADPNLRSRAFVAYYMALAETHPTMQAILSRASDSPEGFTFTGRARKAQEMADLVIGIAHELVLFVFGTQINHFPALAGLQPKLEEASAKLKVIWRRPDGPTPSQRSPLV